MKNLLLVVALALLALGCSEKSPVADSAAPEQPTEKVKGQSAVEDDVSDRNILQIAMGSADHSTLVAAIQAADLEDVLSNPGPLTVFAPTNQAFEELPAGTLDDLLKPENKATLAKIITFHAAPGSYNEQNIKGVMGIGQATGDKVQVEVSDEVTTVNGAKVVASIKASNGYVHVIDKVLLPPEE